MIRLTDPTSLGRALGEIRAMLGISRRQIARQIAATTGRAESSVNAQLWTWDTGDSAPGGRRPDFASLAPYLDALGFDLALLEKVAPDAPRTWPHLGDPPDDVVAVKTAAGTLWARMDGGHYWSAKGHEKGVPWPQLLRWGPITEVKE